MTSPTTVEIYRTSRLGGLRPQRWRFRFIAANGRILAQSSEAYTNRADALKAVALIVGPALTPTERR